VRNAEETRSELALKQISNNTLQHSQNFIIGANNLISEAKLLAMLNHKNIVRLHGVSTSDNAMKSCYTNDNRFCLFLDRLYGTVEEKLNDLRCRKNPQMTTQDILQNLIHIVLPISNALAYLHSHKIIFRDLKPSNMAFDSKGILKLFDFGLARELPSDDGQHKQMTGQTGTRRYMAPEVALSTTYNFSADTYSFGVVLFECLTLLVPFDGMTVADHQQCVVCRGYRPSFPAPCSTPRLVQSLVKRCWSHSPRRRPGMDQVEEVLMQAMRYRQGKISSWNGYHLSKTPSAFMTSFIR
jgi:serine/threonine protein kinase